MTRARPAVTLVELLVAIMIVGLLAGVAGLTVRHAPEPSETARLVAAVMEARRTAVREGRPETIELHIEGDPYAVTALPDGGVVADAFVRERLDIDRLTGAARAATSDAR